MDLKLFGKSYKDLDPDKVYKAFNVQDAKTKITYEVKVRKGNVEINNISRQLFEASALPAGKPCPECNGSGRLK